jgi:hypothetical protein
MCKVLEVSESGFYRFKNNLNKPSRENVLSAALDSILADSPYCVVRHINLGSIRHFKLVENNIKQFTQHINLCFFCALF